ncbi:MAG: 30S ribosomal protein S6 [Deltaproteobacteria bacterium]|nr:30S ribosomal protein S6 [Deltaproteobacteria bacterium]MBW1912052.1 30S ribosomal protein S6 [Deltaproteobacteria bacterium]
MRHYETIYIVDPNVTDEDYREVIEKFDDIIVNQKGVVIKTQEWGKQKLAYPIKKIDRGSYVLVDYCATAGVAAELERNLNLDDRILKYQTIKLADKADPEALLRKVKEAEEESTAAEETEIENEEAVEEEETAIDSEVKDGFSEE